ncbi:MAG: Ribosomal RNA small subunit methyltransferase E [Verrucomicrobia subdivision 3 bacterium]|nr:Ribosomal RNA small subunit methyltransferase E [Limisphaerales bacterium]MCS1414977.1 Ribosomal RNA small subunit methyltransferase E [Limisphaerales bacterium]
MHRFFLPASRCRETTVELSERDTKHAAKVLRLKEKDRFSVLDGQGCELLCQVQKVHKQSVQGKVLSRNTLPALGYELSLVQAVTKGKSMDLIIQKATELGCRTIIPVISERTVTQCDESDSRSKQEKWQTIAVEAMKQCGQGWLPEILPPLSLRALFSGSSLPKDRLSLLASLQPAALHPRKHLEAYQTEHGHPPSQMTVWIGPEGDFTPAEINTIKGSGVLPITLGPLILRSETAAIYALSVLNYELQSP